MEYYLNDTVNARHLEMVSNAQILAFFYCDIMRDANCRMIKMSLVYIKEFLHRSMVD